MHLGSPRGRPSPEVEYLCIEFDQLVDDIMGADFNDYECLTLDLGF